MTRIFLEDSDLRGCKSNLVNWFVSKVILCKRASAATSFHARNIEAMAQAAISRVLIGPYGLHAFGIALLVLFAVFLWVFNFTHFFGGGAL
jgi:hypothetical protein